MAVIVSPAKIKDILDALQKGKLQNKEINVQEILSSEHAFLAFIAKTYKTPQDNITPENLVDIRARLQSSLNLDNNDLASLKNAILPEEIKLPEVPETTVINIPEIDPEQLELMDEFDPIPTPGALHPLDVINQAPAQPATDTQNAQLYNEAAALHNKSTTFKVPTNNTIDVLTNYHNEITAHSKECDTLAKKIAASETVSEELKEWGQTLQNTHIPKLDGHLVVIESKIRSIRQKNDYAKSTILSDLKKLQNSPTVNHTLKEQVESDISAIQSVLTKTIEAPTVYDVAEIQRYIQEFKEYNTTIEDTTLLNGKKLHEISEIDEQKTQLHNNFAEFYETRLPELIAGHIHNNLDNKNVLEDTITQIQTLTAELKPYIFDPKNLYLLCHNGLEAIELEQNPNYNPDSLPRAPSDTTNPTFQAIQQKIAEQLKLRIATANSLPDPNEKQKKLQEVQTLITQAKQTGQLTPQDAQDLHQQAMPNYDYIPTEYAKSQTAHTTYTTAQQTKSSISRLVDSSKPPKHEDFSFEQWEKANEFWTYCDEKLKDPHTSDQEKQIFQDQIQLLNRAFGADKAALTAAKTTRNTRVIVAEDGGLVSIVKKDELDNKIKTLTGSPLPGPETQNAIIGNNQQPQPQAFIGLPIAEDETLLYQNIYMDKTDPKKKVVAVATQDANKITDYLKKDDFKTLSLEDQRKWCLEQSTLALIEAAENKWTKISVVDENPERKKMKYAALLYLKHKTAQEKTPDLAQRFGLSKKWDLEQVKLDGITATDVGLKLVTEGNFSKLQTRASAQKEADLAFIGGHLGENFAKELQGKYHDESAVKASTPPTTAFYKNMLSQKTKDKNEKQPIQSNGKPSP